MLFVWPSWFGVLCFYVAKNANLHVVSSKVLSPEEPPRRTGRAAVEAGLLRRQELAVCPLASLGGEKEWTGTWGGGGGEGLLGLV